MPRSLAGPFPWTDSRQDSCCSPLSWCFRPRLTLPTDTRDRPRSVRREAFCFVANAYRGTSVASAAFARMARLLISGRTGLAACAKAESQQAMNSCAGAAATAADHELAVEYATCLKRFPLQAARLRTAEAAWRTFRDRFCAFEASPYDGGSMQGQVLGDCMARETRLHLKQLNGLRTEWASR
jgi:uncharacterized protein YecT (DUF1311 family)